MAAEVAEILCGEAAEQLEVDDDARLFGRFSDVVVVEVFRQAIAPSVRVSSRSLTGRGGLIEGGPAAIGACFGHRSRLLDWTSIVNLGRRVTHNVPDRAFRRELRASYLAPFLAMALLTGVILWRHNAQMTNVGWV